MTGRPDIPTGFPPRTTPVSRRDGPSMRGVPGRCWGRLKAFSAWLDDSWVGDVISIISLLAIFYLLSVAAWVLSP